MDDHNRTIDNIRKIISLANKIRGVVDTLDLQSLIFSLIYYRKKSLPEEWKALLDIAKSNMEENMEERVRGRLKWSEEFNWLIEYIDFDTMFKNVSLEEKNRIIIETILTVDGLDYENQFDFGHFYSMFMTNFAARLGKHRGEYITPSSLTRLMFELSDGLDAKSIYDPTCGPGGLLNPFFKRCEFFAGQELLLNSCFLARINMGLANVNHRIEMGDTILDDKFKGEKFDLIVANPPYRLKIDKKLEIFKTDERFKGWPISNMMDSLFVMHCLNKLKDGGKIFILMWPSVLFTDGDALFRRKLVDDGYLEAIILLPENLFLGSSINVCLWVLTKEPNENILLIDASQEFTKKQKQNYMEDQHIEKIKNIYFEFLKDRDKYISINEFAVTVTRDDIREADYEMNLNRYLSDEDCEKKIDIRKLEYEATLTSLSNIYSTKLFISNIQGFHDLQEIDADFIKAMDQINWIFEKYGITKKQKPGLLESVDELAEDLRKVHAVELESEDNNKNDSWDW